MSLPYRSPARAAATRTTVLPFLGVATLWVGGMLALFQR